MIMAGEILRQVMELIGPVIKNNRQESQTSGVILLGTVEADIHDLGKNIVNMLFTCHGFTVHDLGVDVPPARFVSETVRLKPDIVGLSGLLTAAYDSMRETWRFTERPAAGQTSLSSSAAARLTSRYRNWWGPITGSMKLPKACGYASGCYPDDLFNKGLARGILWRKR